MVWMRLRPSMSTRRDGTASSPEMRSSWFEYRSKNTKYLTPT